MPPGATVGRNGTVTWTVRGKKRTGKLSGNNKVSMQVDTWTAKFTDETGAVRRIPTKETNRKVAEQILAQYEKDIARIKTGVVTREELDRAQFQNVPLDDLLEQYRTHMVAQGLTQRTIADGFRKLLALLSDCKIDSLAKIRCEIVERWVADEINSKNRAAGTINSYLSTIRCFAQYLVDTDILTVNPIKSIPELNTELDRRKHRRAMTKEEVERLLTATANGITKKVGRPEERVLIYKLLLGTGLRSTELSLLTPLQIDFERCQLRVEAIKTKNRKADILPLRPDLVQALKERMETLGIKPHERFFQHTQATLRKPYVFRF